MLQARWPLGYAHGRLCAHQRPLIFFWIVFLHPSRFVFVFSPSIKICICIFSTYQDLYLYFLHLSRFVFVFSPPIKICICIFSTYQDLGAPFSRFLLTRGWDRTTLFLLNICHPEQSLAHLLRRTCSKD